MPNCEVGRANAVRVSVGRVSRNCVTKYYRYLTGGHDEASIVVRTKKERPPERLIRGSPQENPGITTMNYEILTGPFAGEVVAENQQVLSVESLDPDMKCRVLQFGEDKYYNGEDAGSLPPFDQLVEEYESSWDSVETDEEVTLV